MFSDRDLALALQLQDQFNSEDVSIIRKCSPPKKLNQSFSNLANPDLEFTDPTPNALALFQQFDKRFFWNSLSAVAVRWSKRMTSCAGICRYQARSGFCEIALSEPLLKLRQRKDLVETLLHEMIHAFLFISENDRDRDGHGPNFHKHMYRINQAANVNITVYHSFHEEVHHYQTHWWRCNGPCQNRKPWFGIIRRTQNRAPSPKDFWWDRHRMTCNGTFIKVKEPDSKMKKASKNTVTELDIRKLFSPKKSKSISITGENTNVPINKKIKLDYPAAQIVPVNSNNSINVKKLIPPLQNYSNIHDKRKDNKNSIPPYQNRVDINNYQNSTLPHQNRIDINNKRNDNQKLIPPVKDKVDVNIKNRDIKNTIPTQNKNDINNDAQKLTPPLNKPSLKNIPVSNNTNVKETVRNHWINKFVNEKTLPKDIKPVPITNDQNIANMKADNNNKSTTLNCPLCNVSLKTSQLEQHVQNCLEMTKFNDIFEDEPSETIDLTSFNADSKSTPSSSSSSDNFKDCPVCGKQILGSNLAEHLELCLNTTFDDDEKDCFPANNDSVISLSDSDDEMEVNNLNKSVTHMPCPCCYEMIEENSMNDHLDQCLL